MKQTLQLHHLIMALSSNHIALTTVIRLSKLADVLNNCSSWYKVHPQSVCRCYSNQWYISLSTENKD